MYAIRSYYVLDKWIVRKGIAPRDKQGKFLSRKSISFLIARSIFKKGIQGLSFFQKPLMLGLKDRITSYNVCYTKLLRIVLVTK